MNRLNDGFVLGQRYRLSHLIANGGMGAVWRARDQLLDRDVAIKVMHPSSSDEKILLQRFKDEAQYTARLQSPHIVSVHDYGQHDGLAYLVMELIEGRTATQLVRDEGAVDAPRVASIMSQVAQGLAAAHARGIVHRDVKPSNILVNADGAAKLSDFGIARVQQAAGYTKTGEVLGTPQYLSPEQAQGLPATPASDIYALGVVAHELLTGVRPFDRSTPVATALAHINEPPPPLPPTVPEPLASVVMRCLEKDPARRPASADAIVTTLAGEPAARASHRRRREPGRQSPSGRPSAPSAPSAPTPSGGIRLPAAYIPRTYAPQSGRSAVLWAAGCVVLVALAGLAAIFL